MTDHQAIIAAARARADREVAQGITDLEKQIETCPEFKTGSDPSGKRLLQPARALLVGMLAHLRSSYETEHRKAS